MIMMSRLMLFPVMLCLLQHISGQTPDQDYVCAGQERHYHVDPHPGSVYTWFIDGRVQAGEAYNEFDHVWNSAGDHILEVQELSMDGCLGPAREIRVIVRAEDESLLIIHESFSPNGDLINDTWVLGNVDLYPQTEVFIYNRWGQLVWKSAPGYPQAWDGTGKGRQLPIDSYHYTIDMHNGSRLQIGTVTIVR